MSEALGQAVGWSFDMRICSVAITMGQEVKSKDPLDIQMDAYVRCILDQRCPAEDFGSAKVDPILDKRTARNEQDPSRDSLLHSRLPYRQQRG